MLTLLAAAKAVSAPATTPILVKSFTLTGMESMVASDIEDGCYVVQKENGARRLHWYSTKEKKFLAEVPPGFTLKGTDKLGNAVLWPEWPLIIEKGGNSYKTGYDYILQSPIFIRDGVSLNREGTGTVLLTFPSEPLKREPFTLLNSSDQVQLADFIDFKKQFVLKGTVDWRSKQCVLYGFNFQTQQGVLLRYSLADRVSHQPLIGEKLLVNDQKDLPPRLALLNVLALTGDLLWVSTEYGFDYGWLYEAGGLTPVASPVVEAFLISISEGTIRKRYTFSHLFSKDSRRSELAASAKHLFVWNEKTLNVYLR